MTITDQSAAVSGNSTGVVLTSGASANTKTASFETLIADTSEETYGVHLTFAVPEQDESYLVDIYYGDVAGGNEVLVFGNIPVAGNTDFGTLQIPRLPYTIPVNKKVSAKIQATLGSKTLTCMAWLDNDSSQGTSTANETMGALIASSQGTDVLPATAAIASVADSGTSPGTKVTMTSVAHGMVDGAQVSVTGTTDYDGDFTVSNKTDDTFDIVETFNINRTGTWTSNFTKGAYVELQEDDASPSTNATTIDWDYIVLFLGYSDNNGQVNIRYLVDLATGATGAESVIIADIPHYGAAAEIISQARDFRQSISSGSEISISQASNLANTTQDVDTIMDATIMGFTIVPPAGGSASGVRNPFGGTIR